MTSIKTLFSKLLFPLDSEITKLYNNALQQAYLVICKSQPNKNAVHNQVVIQINPILLKTLNSGLLNATSLLMLVPKDKTNLKSQDLLPCMSGRKDNSAIILFLLLLFTLQS